MTNQHLPKNSALAHIDELIVSAGVLNLKSGILKNNALLENALQTPIRQLAKYRPAQLGANSAFLAWGRKNSYYRTKKIADSHNKPIITLEDGFLRSLDSGIKSRYGASFVVDDMGIYFELTTPNRLETLILDTAAFWDTQKEQYANRLIKKLIDNKLSKYNGSIIAPNLNQLANNNKPNLIIIDQVKNDASIIGAGANDECFFKMLDIAKKTYPNHNIFIKTHPAGLGYFKDDTDNQVMLIKENCNPIALLEQADVVFSVSSHMGFEALLLNKKVYCFGVSWYSGFGLTNDRFSPNELRQKVLKRRECHLKFQSRQITAAHLFYAAYIQYSVYADPASSGIEKSPCDIEVVMDYLITNRNHALRLTGEVLSYQLSRWKAGFFNQFFATPFNHLTVQKKILGISVLPNAIQQYIKNPKTPYKSKDYQHILAWGTAQTRYLANTIYQNKTIWCIEDGFIRSKGLGATLLPPLSLVCDQLGIYYNPKTPSDLENLLATIELDDEQNTKAKQLSTYLLAQNISKYNVGNSLNLKEKIGDTRRVHLVVGQVEDDASILNCLSIIQKNGELLASVREKFPNDTIIYKPHPDVEAGLRVGRVDEKTLGLADFVADNVSISDCLTACDVLHTISSQAGFEALMRGKKVVCYGLPFYAGFGLTDDIANDNPLYIKALARRQRQTPLSLTALIYATLIAYPLYRLPDGYGLAQAWQVAEFLADQKTTPQKTTITRTIKTSMMQWRHRLLGKT